MKNKFKRFLVTLIRFSRKAKKASDLAECEYAAAHNQGIGA